MKAATDRSFNVRTHFRRAYAVRVPPHIPTPLGELPFSVRWLFLFFIFTIPLEAADVGFTTGTFSLSKAAGLLFFAFYFYYHNPLAPRPLPQIDGAMRWFLVYLIIFVISGAFVLGEFSSAYFVRLSRLIQLMVFFWISSSMLKEQRLGRLALIAYSIGAVVLAIGGILNLPGFDQTTGQDRVAATDKNPNDLAMILVAGAITLIGIVNYVKFRSNFAKVILLSMTLPLALVTVMTGSRAAIGALVLGSAIFLIPKLGSKFRATPIFIGVLAIVATLFLVANNPKALERWTETIYEGKTAGRDVITLAAVEMFLERPLIGWQPAKLWEELGYRVGRIWGGRDTHNLFLHLLLEVGLLGTIPFLAGLWLCARAAWRTRDGPFGLLPTALLLTTMAFNLTHNGLATKPFWFVLAVCVAATPRRVTRPNRSTSISLQRSNYWNAR